MTAATQQSRIRLASEGVLASYIHDIATPARKPAEGETARVARDAERADPRRRSHRRGGLRGAGGPPWAARDRRAAAGR